MTKEIQNLGFTQQQVQNNSLVEVSESRAVAEVQAGYIIAQKFPRNELECYKKIIESCKRRSLAEQALYAYPRGGTLVTRPSIRLAEALAQAWKHIEFGINEISQSGGVSIAEAYAIDKQNGTNKRLNFHVRHERHTKKGVQKLTDPRDIYELVANYGARRVRTCILAIMRCDVVEDAVECCKKTLESSDEPISEQIKKMVLAFDELGVKVEHLEKRLGHNLDATIPTEIVTLKSIYKSIRDGMSDRSNFFDISSTRETDSKNEITQLINDKKTKIKEVVDE